MIRLITSLTLSFFVILWSGMFAVAQSEPETGQAGIDSKFDDDVAKVIADARREGNIPSSGVGTVVQSAVEFEVTYVPACDSNTPDIDSSADGLCPSATEACAAMGQRGVLYWIYQRPVLGSGVTAEWRFIGQECRSPGNVPEAAVPVFTEADFRRLPLPAGQVNVQPPNGRTLINVPTNVYVDADEVTLPTELLGFPVRVRATPSRFVWRFGDGSRLSTKDKGAPYPDLRTTHTYKRPGSVRLRLTTVYTGVYSVAGGPFLPIEGTAQVQSPAAGLTVLAAENRLVADPVPGLGGR